MKITALTYGYLKRKTVNEGTTDLKGLNEIQTAFFYLQDYKCTPSPALGGIGHCNTTFEVPLRSNNGSILTRRALSKQRRLKPTKSCIALKVKLISSPWGKEANPLYRKRQHF